MSTRDLVSGRGTDDEHDARCTERTACRGRQSGRGRLSGRSVRLGHRAETGGCFRPHVCRAGFAGRGTTLALRTECHTLAPDPTRDKVSGRVNMRFGLVTPVVTRHPAHGAAWEEEAGPAELARLA